MSDYTEFLRQKIKMANFKGFSVEPENLSPILFPHQRDIVKWAVLGGNRAIFAKFGMGKSVMQCEWLRQITSKTTKPGLIVCPLGVRQELVRDGKMVGLDLKFIRTNAEITDGHRHYITNYESIREGKITPANFDAVSLDEASVLRSYGSKTYQEFLPLFAGVEFKLVNTATPSPNRFKELIHYAGFLGVMDTGQALTRFFQRDSTKANSLTLYPHKEKEFWLWVSSWAVFAQTPSDLGYSDEGYDLPALEVVYHEVPTDYAMAGTDRDGQNLMFQDPALGLSAASAEKRNSLEQRLAKVVKLCSDYFIKPEQEVKQDDDGQGTVSPVVRREQGGFVGEAEAEKQGQLLGKKGCDSAEIKAVGRKQPGASKTAPTGIQGEEQGQIGRKAQSDLREQSLRRIVTEKTRKDKELWDNAGKVRCNSEIAGEFMRDMQSGQAYDQREWELQDRSLPRNGDSEGLAVQQVQCGFGDVFGQDRNASNSHRLFDQIIIWCDLNSEQEAIEKALDKIGISYSSVHGALTTEEAERRVAEWKDRKTCALIGKPVMLGQGMNLQQCNKAIYIGITYKFNDLIQSLHRIQRYGQTRTCEAHIIYSEAEREVLRTLQQKWTQHEELVKNMTEIIKTYGLNQLAMHETLSRSIGIERLEVKSDLFTVANNDCVEEAKLQPDNHIDLMVTSIPFANHYEYSPSYNDFGHTENNDHFWRQMDHLTPELLRILKPGRIYACHVKDRIMFGNVTGAGAPTVSPFHCEAIMHGIKHGFDYMGLITVVTDVVRENNQTYRLSWSEQCKDGTKMGVGSPEYIVLFRKPQTDRSKGYADEPVRKDKPTMTDDAGDVIDWDKNKQSTHHAIPGTGYSRARWQIDAHAFWRSSGNRQITAEELSLMGPDKLASMFTKYSLQNIYDYEFHVKIGEELEARGALPSTFMSLAPGSHDQDVWHDVTRMLTLNGDQAKRNVEKHICPLQFDIIDRLIERYSNKGDMVYDPFCGLGSVPYRAILKGRKGGGSELNPAYFLDQVHYLKSAEKQFQMPSLFDVLDECA